MIQVIVSGLVQKAGLVEGDHATLYGALLDLAGRAPANDTDEVLALRKCRGKRAFYAEAEDASPPRPAP
jgi:hypothetical protein